MKQEAMVRKRNKKTNRNQSQNTVSEQDKKEAGDRSKKAVSDQYQQTVHDPSTNTIRDQPQNAVRNQARERQALQDTIYVIGGKWRLPIINSICNGNKRFREIERSIPGITTRMLSRELKEMELNKLITRTVYAGPPVLVEYESTGYCKSFGPVILAMIEWGIAHRKKILEKEH